MPSSTKNLESSLAQATDPSKTLGLSVGSKTITKPGEYVPKADAQSPPQISYRGAESSKTYLAICIDLDAPFRSFPILGPILHWVQSGLRSSGNLPTLQSSDPAVADWVAPAPPRGAGPHRYTVFLYEQPQGFEPAKYAPADGQKMGLWSRVRYDLDAFEKQASLGPAVAVNHFESN